MSYFIERACRRAGLDLDRELDNGAKIGAIADGAITRAGAGERSYAVSFTRILWAIALIRPLQSLLCVLALASSACVTPAPIEPRGPAPGPTPQVSAPPPAPAATSAFEPDLRASGELFLAGQRIAFDGSVTERARAANVPSGQRVVLDIEPDVRHEHVIHLLDLLKQAGLARYAFDVRSVGERERAPRRPTDPLLTLDLPRAGDFSETAIVLSVRLERDKERIVDEKPMPDVASFVGYMRSARAANPALWVVIRADKDVLFGDVARSLALVRAAGLESVAFAVTPVQPPTSPRGAAPNSARWDCSFPPEATTNRIDSAEVTIRVLVAPDGSAKSVIVMNDPGSGFAEAAVACAMKRQFVPARDQSGAPLEATSPPIHVRFVR